MAYQPFIGRQEDKKIVVKKIQPTSEYPYLDKPGSCCYNVTLIARTESRSEDNHMEVNNFHTGIAIVSLPPNTYLEFSPHPSLYKNGYTLFGPMVVDNSYKGEIIVPLYKFRDIECLDLPFPAVQFVVKSTVNVFIAADEIKKQSDEYSSYGSGGNVIFQSESSGSGRGGEREIPYKGQSGRGGKTSGKKGNHMF